MSLSEQEIIRREKLQKLTEMGINAFPADEYKITDTTKSIKNDFAEGKSVKIAGRLMSRRIQGRLLSQNYKILKAEFRCILIVMKSVLAKIKHFIMKSTNIF